jgi:hypothetical protein
VHSVRPDWFECCFIYGNRRKNYSFQLVNVHSVSDVRQLGIHTVEPLVPDPSHLEVEMQS